ncbi:MAG TPA: hypothetical protein VIB38_03020, partial [Aestuariivirgaceae bacterium]
MAEESCKEPGILFQSSAFPALTRKHFQEVSLPDFHAVRQALFADETQLVTTLSERARLSPPDAARVKTIAR